MTSSFVHADFPTEHAGIARLERSVSFLRAAWRGTAQGSLALAAVVAAAVVVANEVVDTWTDGHLLAAWIVMWLVAFAALAVFATPMRSVARRVAASLAGWRARRAEAAEDRRVWELALQDARVMADISRAMSNVSLRDARYY
jgi:hypothetical protein